MPFVVAALLAFGFSASPTTSNLAPLDDRAPVHLGVAFRLADTEGLRQLLAVQQDPSSPSYHAWLDPESFGARFGLSEADYGHALDWFRAHGFVVTPYPNRLFVEAVGHAAAVREAFGVQQHWAVERGRRYRTFDGPLQLPPSFGAKVLHIAGLDTRIHLRHRLYVTVDNQRNEVLGAMDLRTQYDMAGLMDAGDAAAGLTTAVLATQEGTSIGTAQTCFENNPGPPLIAPSPDAIQTYFKAFSNATATYNPIVISNPNDDFDSCGSNQEFELDAEMQSVGAPNASDIDMVLSPASEVFVTGAEYIVNTLSTAVVVSTSLGLCEYEEARFTGGGPTASGSEMQVMQQAVQQGIAEGQTWFASSGDEGADDCNDQSSGTGNGFDGGNATVDFPASMPEFVAMGGTQFNGKQQWDTGGNLIAPTTELVWNEQESLPVGEGGGAGGGGQSAFFPKPAYQLGVGPEAGDGARDLPDLALIAASNTPGIAVYNCGSGQDQTCPTASTSYGTIDIFGGTSVSAPLAAGIFALIAGRVGCHLGDIHTALYTLGQAQTNCGAQVFHDVTSGNNSFLDPGGADITGYTAGPGYDLASGWGSLDVAALLANWPSCGSSTGTAAGSSGSSGSMPHCTGGSTGTTSGGASTGTGGAATGSTSTSTGSSSGSAAAAGTTSTGGSKSGGCSSGGEAAVLCAPLALLWLRLRRRARARG